MTGGTRTAWFHCFAGVAGDMTLGALLDAGAAVDEVLALLGRLPLPGWTLEVEEVLRGGVAGTRVVVRSNDDVVVRTHAHIVGLVTEARLPPRVAARALAVFRALAEVEGELHRRPVERVHFHEVGGHDTVVEVVGVAAALEVLDLEAVTASPVATGTGTVRSAHGLLPNPSPAAVRLLARAAGGSGAPTYGRDTPVELTTPTGAALLAVLADRFGPLPPLTVEASGFGAGTAELENLPNCLQVVVGRAGTQAPGPGQPVTILEANLDDATGEQLGRALERLLAAGARDVWISPVVMKKGRPGHTIHVLCDPVQADPLRTLLAEATGSLGVRASAGERWTAPRRTETIEVDGHPVRMKITPGRAKPEFDDVDRVAGRTGRPAQEVASRAEEAWRRRPPGPGDGDPA